MRFSNVLCALEQNGHDDTTVLASSNRDLIVTFPDETLYEAATKMLRNDIGRLPVVSRQNSRRMVGYLGRSNLMAVICANSKKNMFVTRGF